MKSIKELELTKESDLTEWIYSVLQKAKPGEYTSIEKLLDLYFYDGNHRHINPNNIYKTVFSEAREHYILLDNSELFGVKTFVLPYKRLFKVWNKRKYMSEDLFRSLCEEYDELFISLEVDDSDFAKKKDKILHSWKKSCGIFKRNPNKPSKPKKAIRIKDLDNSPYSEPIPEELEKKNIKIIPIASGSKGNSLYIEIENIKILIDTGVSVKKIEKALSVNERKLEDIQAIFITHGHSDHISSIKAISKVIGCPIYTSEWTANVLKTIGVESVVIEPYERKELFEGLIINMFSAEHDFIMTYGFVFETKACKVSYLTDNGYYNDKRLRQMYGSDVAILEANYDLDKLEKRGANELTWRISATHSSNIRCGYCMISLHDKGTRNFILAHVSSVNNSKKLIEETIKKMMRSRYANVYICDSESETLLSY